MAFNIPNGHYKNVVLPFGLCNALVAGAGSGQFSQTDC